MLVGSRPSFSRVTFSNTLAVPITVTESYGDRPGRPVTAWAGASTYLEYAARNVGLMGCMAVAQVPPGLTGWVVSDPNGRRVFVPSGRLDRLYVAITLREADFARGRLE